MSNEKSPSDRHDEKETIWKNFTDMVVHVAEAIVRTIVEMFGDRPINPAIVLLWSRVLIVFVGFISVTTIGVVGYYCFQPSVNTKEMSESAEKVTSGRVKVDKVSSQGESDGVKTNSGFGGDTSVSSVAETAKTHGSIYKVSTSSVSGLGDKCPAGSNISEYQTVTVNCGNGAHGQKLQIRCATTAENGSGVVLSSTPWMTYKNSCPGGSLD